jgi:hypothetical protein
MQIDEQRQVQIKDVFKCMLEYEEMNTDNNQAKNDALKNLVESMSANKDERKQIKKSMLKAFKEYKEEQKGEPDTLNDALTIVQFTCRGKDVE